MLTIFYTKHWLIVQIKGNLFLPHSNHLLNLSPAFSRLIRAVRENQNIKGASSKKQNNGLKGTKAFWFAKSDDTYLWFILHIVIYSILRIKILNSAPLKSNVSDIFSDPQVSSGDWHAVNGQETCVLKSVPPVWIIASVLLAVWFFFFFTLDCS